MKHIETPAVPYDQKFYDEIEPDALRSARVIVPIVMELLNPSTVLDVGCGTGTWLGEFLNHGVSRVMGVDGDYVDVGRLRIPPEDFRSIDLRHAPAELGRFDLAICLEVAEHLPEECAASLVRLLVSASDFVLFSAAMPGQDGTDHINEQWPHYWRTLFAEHGYEAVDLIGPRIRSNRSVGWWYRQNLLLFESRSAAMLHPEWGEYRVRRDPLEWVHISIASKDESVRAAWKRLKRVAQASISGRWRRMKDAGGILRGRVRPQSGPEKGSPQK